ncbi:hypothetical protein F5Y00DRAFT_259646 [Daldinia vernicosa]|uniref:uncharacterized protein n=1 Tax=Daldinia vernicosa TaxID=114800 RepID=UPI00200851D3|nr:uncharacterized protein F5Y00DRAFT_259646 [Daldinia vernicosa]KAI0851106.1 hypothetical protein F5Y00DRAFT_259646 [Daldinia vernicosa]
MRLKTPEDVMRFLCKEDPYGIILDACKDESIDWSDLQWVQQNCRPSASYPKSPMPCRHCGVTASTATTSYSNTNGNAGRPYFKCPTMGKFLVFADARGNDPTNPLCRCGVSSKRTMSGFYNARTPGKLFYVCRIGMCEFNKECRDARGGQVVVDPEIVDYLILLEII